MISEHGLLIGGIILQELEGLDLFSLRTIPDHCPLFCPLWMVLGIVVSFSVNSLKLCYCCEVLHLIVCLKIGWMGLQHCSSCSKGCSRHLKWPKVAKGLLWCLKEFEAKEHSRGVPRLTLWSDNSQHMTMQAKSLWCGTHRHIAQHPSQAAILKLRRTLGWEEEAPTAAGQLRGAHLGQPEKALVGI